MIPGNALYSQGFASFAGVLRDAEWQHGYCRRVVQEGTVHGQKRAGFNKFVAGLLLPGSHRADIRMRSHRLLRLDDTVASCQQAWCKLVVKTCFVYKLDASCFNKSENVKLHQVASSLNFGCNLMKLTGFR